MSFSNLTASQMVTETDAQTSGIPLKSGQSHVSSTKCMTNAEATARYSLGAAALGSYASNQLIPKSAWVADVSHLYSYSGSSSIMGAGESLSAGCGLPANATLVFYSDKPLSDMTVGDHFYYTYNTAYMGIYSSDENGNEITHIGTYSFRINANTSNNITEVYNCAASYAHSFSSTSTPDANTACGFGGLSLGLYSSDDYNSMGIGTVFYNEVGLSTTYIGDNQYRFQGTYAVKINGSGVVTDIYNCGAE